MTSQDSDNVSSPGSEADIHVINNLESSMLEEMRYVIMPAMALVSITKAAAVVDSCTVQFLSRVVVVFHSLRKQTQYKFDTDRTAKDHF